MMHRLQEFMKDRSGPDALSMTMSFAACLLLLLAMLLHSGVSALLWIVALLLLVFSYIRIFSRDVPRRQAENVKFLTLFQPIGAALRRRGSRRRQRNCYVFFQCPACKTIVRIPKNRKRTSETVRVHCPHCGNDFLETR